MPADPPDPLGAVSPVVNLLQWTEPYKMRGGITSRFKVECDALTREDCKTVAQVVAPIIEPFDRVEPVRSTGPVAAWLADAFMEFAVRSWGSLLIVDDVLTTGGSMEEQRAGRDAIGAVIFARGPVLPWVTPMFTLAGGIA